MPLFLFYGLVAVAILWTASAVRKDDRYDDFCVGAGLLFFFLGVLIPMTVVESWLRPLTWDGRLQHVDQALGLNGFGLGRLYASSPWFHLLIRSVYETLPVAFALGWIVDRSKTMLRAVVIGGILAFPLYILVPACGPAHVFAGYPVHTIVPSGLIAVDLGVPRNCFPSLHCTWALLLALNAKPRGLKLVLTIYAVLVAISTVACGEHYFADVIAAVPFTFGVQSIAVRKEQIRAWLQNSRLSMASQRFSSSPAD
jgi:membrane-associated phospholipid phosphatase